jgi:hypothetical protein
MEVVLLGIFAAMFFVMAALDKQVAFLGMIGGIGLVILGLLTATGGIQVQTGLNQTYVNGTDHINFVYQNLTSIYPDASSFMLLMIIGLGAAGLLITIYSLTHGKA